MCFIENVNLKFKSMMHFSLTMAYVVSMDYVVNAFYLLSVFIGLELYKENFENLSLRLFQLNCMIRDQIPEL